VTDGKTFIFGIDLAHPEVSYFTWATWPQGAVHFD